MQPTVTPRHPGWFIAFEGLDAAGKSFATWGILWWARQTGSHSAIRVHYREVPFGAAVFDAVLGKNRGAECPWQAAVLGLGSALEYLTRELIKPHLADGALVLADRYTESTAAAQGEAGGDPAKIHDFLMNIVECVQPDLTILLYTDKERLRARRTSRGTTDPTHPHVLHSASPERRASIERELLSILGVHPERYATVNSGASERNFLRRIGNVLRERAGLDLPPDHLDGKIIQRARDFANGKRDWIPWGGDPMLPKLGAHAPSSASIQVPLVAPDVPFEPIAPRLDLNFAGPSTTVQLAFDGLSGSARKQQIQVAGFMLAGLGYRVLIASPYSTQRGTEMTYEIRYPDSPAPSALSGFLAFCGAIWLTELQVVRPTLEASHGGSTAVLWNRHMPTQYAMVAAEGADVDRLKDGLNTLWEMGEIPGIYVSAKSEMAQRRKVSELWREMRLGDRFQVAHRSQYEIWERSGRHYAEQHHCPIIDGEQSPYEVAQNVAAVIDDLYHTGIRWQLTPQRVNEALRTSGHELA